MKHIAVRGGVLLLGLLVWSVPAEPPVGLANQAYPEDELFTVISQRRSMGVHDSQFDDSGWVDNPTYALLMNGYLAIAGKDALSFFDLSDPYTPTVVATHRFSERWHTVENDGWGFTTGYGGVHAVVMDTTFLEIWNYADHTNPVHVGTVQLPPPYQPTDLPQPRPGWGFPIGVAWQAPYLYSSMRLVGIDIIDVHDPANPEAVSRFDEGFGPSNIHVVGNLLVEGKYNGTGIATFDISDPLNPVLLDSETEGRETKGWQVWVNGNKVFRSGERVDVWDITDPADMQHIKTFERGAGCHFQTHGHCASGGTETQDGFLFFGGSHWGLYKWNLETDELVGNMGPYLKPGGDSENKTHFYDLDYPNVFGNLMVGCSEDHYQGMFISPHQAEPDNTPPEVNMVVPKDGSTNEAVTSRVGLTFTDAIDATSVTTETFIVRKSGGSALPGKYSFYKSIVNFSPDEPLEQNATYEVVVPAGGVTDYMGNATAKQFVSAFATGDAVAVRPDVGRIGVSSRRPGKSIRMEAFAGIGGRETRVREQAMLYSVRGSRIRTETGTDGSAETGTVTPGVYVIKPIR